MARKRFCQWAVCSWLLMFGCSGATTNRPEESPPPAPKPTSSATSPSRFKSPSAVPAPSVPAPQAQPEPEPEPDTRVAVGVAPLQDDDNGEMRRFLIDALSKTDSAIRVIEVENAPEIVDRERLVSGDYHLELQQSLDASGTNILIWGQVVVAGGTPTPRLLLASAGAGSQKSQGIASGAQEIVDITLPALPWTVLEGLLKLVVMAQAIAFDETLYRVVKIDPLIQNVRALVEGDGFESKWSSDNRWEVLEAYAGALYTLGVCAGNRETLMKSIAAHQRALSDVPRKRVPLLWASTQNNLGAALMSLGQQEPGTRRLKDAVTAYREALKERKRDRVPLLWATTQNNLGTALMSLGQREPGTRRLKDAVTAYQEALKEYTRERVPLLWATTQNNLGTALVSLGQRESSSDGEASNGPPRNPVPLLWEAPKTDLGDTLMSVGMHIPGKKRLEDAADAYREALKERKKERLPFDWAATQISLGNVLTRIGEREKGTERLEDAAVAYSEALKAYTRKRAPLDWAMTQNNLGYTLTILGERESSENLLQEAVTAFRAALKERKKARMPLDWAATQNNLGYALRLLAKHQGKAPCDAVTAHHQALTVFQSEVAPQYLQIVLDGLRRDLSAPVEPTQTACPEIPEQVWKDIRAVLYRIPVTLL